MTNIRQLLVDRVRRIPGDAVAVATSGGIDSSALATAAWEAGKHVTVVSFRLAGRESSDFVAARKFASRFGHGWMPVVLPTHPDLVAADITEIIRRYGARKKTAVECLFPFLHVFRQMAHAGIRTPLLVGSGADGHFGLSKKAMIHHRGSVQSFQQFRAKYFANPDAAQRKTLADMGRAHRIDVHAPYFDTEVYNLWTDCAWADLNKPRQKEAIRKHFPELDPLKIAPHTNLQLGDSGIAALVGKVAIARFAPGAKSPVAAYNLIARTT